MKICIRNISPNECEPSNEEEFMVKKEYDAVMDIYKETGKCPYCGSSVEYLGEDVYKEIDYGSRVVDIKEVDKEFMRFIKNKKPIQNKVIDAGWYNHLKCSECNFRPMLKSNIREEIWQKIRKE